MESKDKKVIYIGIVMIALLLISTTGVVILNSKNKNSLNSEKLHSESLLSEKLQIEKELAKVENDLESLKTQFSANEKILGETQATLAEKGKRLAFLSKEIGTLNKNKKELEDLQLAKSKLDADYAILKSDSEKIASRNKDLQNSVAILESEKNGLAKKLSDSELYRTDNFEIFGSRGNKKDKLTYCASRTKKMNINFDVPQSLTSEISFNITTPSGTTITPDNKSLTWNVVQNPASFTASLSSLTGEFEQARQVVLTYVSKEKLLSGEYKITIFSDGNTIGNCRVKLK